jgi:hypothetical protein
MTAFCFSALLLLSSAAAAGGPALDYYVSDGDLFHVSLPVAWARNEAITARRQLLQYGVDSIGPGSAEDGRPRISVMYYAKGHKQFRTMDKYVTVNSRPAGFSPLKGEKFSPVSSARTAGREARQLEAVRVEYLPPHSARPRKIRFYQKQLVFPGKTGGFFVLEYYSPLDAAKEYLPVFEAVAASLKINI